MKHFLNISCNISLEFIRIRSNLEKYFLKKLFEDSTTINDWCLLLIVVNGLPTMEICWIQEACLLFTFQSLTLFNSENISQMCHVIVVSFHFFSYHDSAWSWAKCHLPTLLSESLTSRNHVFLKPIGSIFGNVMWLTCPCSKLPFHVMIPILFLMTSNKNSLLSVILAYTDREMCNFQTRISISLWHIW